MIADDLFRLHCLGRWQPSQVTVDFVHRDHVLPGDLPARAQQYWESTLAPRLPGLFNGALCRLDGFDVDPAKFNLRLSRTNYRDLLYCNAHLAELVAVYGEETMSRALGISVVIETADGFLPLMRRSVGVGESPGTIDVFGGHPHPEHHARNGVPDVFVAIADEMRTELGLLPEAAGEISCIGLLATLHTRKPELVFETRLALSMAELRRAARQAQEAAEYVELLAIPARAGDLEALLTRDKGSFSPSGYGCLVMFGLIRNWWQGK